MAELKSFRDIRHSPEFRRFLSINQGLNETGVLLENYVATVLQGIHDRIKNNLVGLPPCGQRCSEVYRNEQRWCQTCREWKRELEQYFRNNWIKRDVKWHKLKSGTWPAAYRDTLDVFLPQFMHQPRHDLQDITTVLFLFENITDFNVVPLDLIKAIRKIRNRYKHGGLMKATQRDTNKTFMLLRNLIQIQDISATLDMNSVSLRLQKIENGELLQYEFDIMARMQNLDQNVEYIRQEIDDLSRITRTLNEISSLAKHTLISLTVCILVGVQAMPRQYTYRQLRTLLLITIVASLYHQVGIIHPKQACFDENYNYPWSNEVKLMGYLKSQHNLTGRKWLLGDIEATLRNTSSDSPGILLAADMGYGKSAIVSHLACAQFGEAGNWVTSRILAIHVCRYDALNSQNPALMIRRLIGLIAKRMPEYSSSITMSETVLQELSQRYCLVDPKGCMDQGVLFPLNDIIEPPTEPLIIIIDALDECETFGNPYASIADLLSKSMHSFPAWIKFLVTSRYDIRLQNKFPTLNKIILRESDDRNIEDVKLYIQSWLQKDEVLVRNIRACLMNNSINEIIENLLEASLGNFLHITHALKYWSASSNSACQKLPSSLDKVIELNFKRLYGENGEWFDSSRPVFAVICASAEPLTIHMLRQVLNITDMVTFKTILVNGSHFIRIENDIASLTHIAVYEWLTSPKRIGSSFFVNVSAGHTAIASYLVQRLQRENGTVDIVDLAMHAIESQQQGLISRIRKLSLNSVIQNQSEENILYRLVTKTNSYEIASLVLHFIDDVDAGRKRNVTAAFNASALGHQYTLMALLDAGADITFRASGAVFCWHCPPGFALGRQDLNHGLLDIAVDRGHLTIVNVLLERNKTLILDSEFETSAFPLACAKGRTLYLKKFVEIYPHLANQRCLHHAAFNGHIHLVQYLNEMGVVDTCLTCDRIFNLINAVYMDHGMIRMRRSVNELDILWEMNLETALHAAAKAGHTEIVTYLISAKQNAINCVDRFGKTPFLTAVSYNHTDIVLLLGSSSDVNQKCSSPCQCCQRSVINKLYMIGVRDESQLCSPDTSAIHIMTSNNFYYMLSQIDLQYVNRINWTIADGEGIQPLHIASCHGFASIIRLILPKVVLNISQFLTLNGSSPFHSAVSCLSAEGLQVLLEFFSKKDIGIQDSYGMTLLHYLSRIDFKRPYLYQTWEDEIILVDILDTIRKYRNVADLLQVKDVYGRNVYHYIVANGLLRIFFKMFGIHPSNSLQMLSSPDVNGQTPLVFSIENLPYHFHMDDKNTYILPAWCQLHQIFLKNCSITTHNFSYLLMSSKEYMIIELVEKLKDQIWKDSFETYVHNFIVKGSLYLTAYWLSKFKSFYVKNELGESPTTTYLKYGKDHCTGFLLFGGERSHLLLQCGKPLYHSPLHAIMMFINQRFWFFKPSTPYTHMHNINMNITGECVNPDAFEELVSNISVKALEECFDEEGFNILHRALLGSGHIQPFGLLKQMGMSVTPTAHGFGGITTAFLLHEHLFKKKKVYYNFAEEREPNEEIQDTLTIQLLCTPDNMRKGCRSRLSYFKESRHPKHTLFHRQFEVDLDSFDVSSAEFVSSNAKSITLEDICSRIKPLLSIVHLAAINGLLQTLQAIANQWGTDVLGCLNVHGITPLYLAEKFKQDDIAKYLQSLDIRSMPIREEIEFLMKLYVIPTRSSHFRYSKYGIYGDSAGNWDSVIKYSAYKPPRRLLECIYNLGRSSKTMTLLFRTNQCLYIALKSYFGSMYTQKSTHFTVELLKLREIEHRLTKFNILVRTRTPFTCRNRYLSHFFRQGTCSTLTFISKRSYFIFQRFGSFAAIADQKISLRRALVSLWRRIYGELMRLWCDLMEYLRSDLQMAFTKIEDLKIDVKEYISRLKQRCNTLSNTILLYFNDHYKYLKILKYTYPHNVLKRGGILGWL